MINKYVKRTMMRPGLQNVLMYRWTNGQMDWQTYGRPDHLRDWLQRCKDLPSNFLPHFLTARKKCVTDQQTNRPMDWQTNGPTDWQNWQNNKPKDGQSHNLGKNANTIIWKLFSPTDGPTHPLIEMLGCIFTDGRTNPLCITAILYHIHILFSLIWLWKLEQ